MRTWSDLNPEYRHEVLTDEMMEDYVKDHFHVSHPDIESIYFEVKDYILRTDLIRYLILLTEGGVYNDLDVGCEKPIKTWVPPQYKDNAGILLGVEVDNKFGPDGRTFQGGQDLFQLVNWTIMSKPNQPFMWFLVTRVLDNIKKVAASRNQPISKMTYSMQDVLEVTGPGALTKAFFDYASDITDTNVTYLNFTKMTKPRLIGEVVILPVQAFGASHQVEWAGMEQDGSELIHHYFAGSWKTDHDDKPPQLPSVDEGQKEEQDTKSAKEEKQKQEEVPAQKLGNEAAEHGEKQQAEMNDIQAGNVTADSPADNKPAESQVAAQDSEKQTASDKPASVQYVENTAIKTNSTSEQPAEKEPMMDKIEKAKAAKEAALQDPAAAQEQQDTAEVKATAEEQEEAAQKKLAEEEAAKKELADEEAVKKKAAEEKAAAEKKAQEEKESQMTQEEKEEEERKRKWAEVVAAAPKEAKPKTDEEKQKVTNDLADYDYIPD